MEDLLHLYTLPYNAKRPVVCFDALPVQLLNDVGAELPMTEGKLARFAYEYARAGTASLLVAIEPRAGTRGVERSRQRTRAAYCRFQQRGAALFPDADKLVLVQDTLTTHTAGAFYKHLPPTDALALAQRFEFHYTPQKGSWLNIAELELSALSRLWLSRRLGSIEALDHEVQALVKARNKAQSKVDWQFSLPQAREKLHRHYEKVNTKN
jgi:hypothetical protein